MSVRAPLSRGIQRFTGITQAMVDEAPPAEAMLPDLAEQLRGPRARRAQRRVRPARARPGVRARGARRGPSPPSLCTVALARRFHPLARQRRLRPLAESLGIEVEVTHRALADAETCARVFCALFARLCANAATIGDALALLRPARPAAPARGATRTAARRACAARAGGCPTSAALPDEPGVYVVRNAEGQALYVGKSVSVRTRARAHFAPSAAEGAWAAQAETVEHEVTNSELGALVLESRLVKRLRPPGNVRLKHVDNYVYLRCRLDIAFPVLEVAPGPAPGPAVSVGPLRGRALAVELLEQLNSLFGLRHCGRRLKLRAVAVGVRADGPLPVAVPERPRPEPLPPPARRGARAVHRPRRRRRRAAAPHRRPDARGRRGRALRARGVAAAPPRAPRRPARAPRRRDRGEPRAAAARARRAPARRALRRVLARRRPRRRLGRRSGDLDDVVRAHGAPRCAAATAPGPTTSLAPDEVDDARIVATWLASHDAATLDLARAPRRAGARALRRADARASEARRERRGRGPRASGDTMRARRGGVRGAASAETAGSDDDLRGHARRRRRPRACRPGRPRGARARARSAPCRGETATARRRCPTSRSPRRSGGAALDRLGQPQPAQVAVRLAAPVQPRDGLLADVAALREAHGAVVEPGLLGDRRVVERRSRSAGGRTRRARSRRPPRRRATAPAATRASLHARGVVGRRRRRRRPRSVTTSRTGAPAISPAALACSSARQRVGAGDDRAGARPDHRQQPLLERALVQLGVPADRAAADLVEERLQRGALADEQQLVAGREHAQVAEHLALVRQERRVAAGARARAPRRRWRPGR